MIGEIIAIGDELTSGRIVNTTSGYAARQLFLMGHTVVAMHTIGDGPELIGKTLKEAIERSDFVLVTGGLGATTDDLTNEAVIKAFHLKLVIHPGVQANIALRMSKDKDDCPVGSLEKLAQLPEGAEVLDDECRMAGYLLRYQGKPLYFLPGVPPQMEILLRDKVLPSLKAFDASPILPVNQRIYRTCGLYETEINKRLHSLEQQGMEIGYYPVGCEVDISLTAPKRTGGTDDSAVHKADAFICEALGDNLYGIGQKSLAGVSGTLLQEQGLMLGVAESCTGGLISAAFTEIPGSSRWFKGGVVVYTNELKELLLGIDPALIARYGAVSAEIARAMAVQAAQRLGCDIAIAATGIAGPGGGTEDKPVGTVYLGLFHRNTVIDQLCQLHGSRRQIQEKTAQTAVDMVRRALLTS